jgi:predicted DCC family thiol-disulfide oxidoreductase YuxK
MATDAQRPPIIVYDDACGFCTRSVRLLTRLDWLRRLDRLGYSVAVERYPEVSRGLLDEGVRVRFPDHTVTVGIDAVRSALVRTPLGLLPAALLYIPPVRWVGARVYRLVAARRRRDLACPVPDRG